MRNADVLPGFDDESLAGLMGSPVRAPGAPVAPPKPAPVELSAAERASALAHPAPAGTVFLDTFDADPTVETLSPEQQQIGAGWADALGVFDLETTGVDTASARIVTAHVGLIDETGAVVERKDWIVDPGIDIPDGAAAVHGISTARARRFGRLPADVVPEIVAAIQSIFDRGFPLVIYNAPYDLTLLAAEAARWGVAALPLPAPVIDPLVIDKAVDRYRKGKRTLSAATAEYGVPLDDAHDAGADAIAAGRLAQAMARRHATHLALSAADLHALQIDWCETQARSFEEYMQRTKDPAFTTSGAWPLR